MKGAFLLMLRWFIPETIRQDTSDRQRQASLIVFFSFLLALFGTPFALEGYFISGNASLGLTTLGASVLVAAIPLLLRSTGSLFLAGHSLMFALVMICTGLAWITDGLHSTPMINFTGIPLVAILLMGVYAGIFWTIAGNLIYLMFYVLETGGHIFSHEVSAATARFDLFTSLAGQMLIICVLAALYENTKNSALKQLEQANEQLEETNTELEKARVMAIQANKAKSHFLANMSHEIRTPLNAILGYAELMKEDAQELGVDDFTDDLDRIHISGNHLLGLINDILDLSRIEAGKIELHIEEFAIPELLEELEATLQPLIARNSNTFHCELNDTIGIMQSDQTRLRQSLLNLLSNACKFTTKGNISLLIERVKVEGEDWLRFAVSDTGIGITPEQLDRLFQPFSQADSSTSKKYGGTGLGLVLTQKFCELMQGEVKVTSEAGEGSTFTICLPARLEPPSPS